ncbi:hypothetical protein F442_12133 [Phytophthora nicotianae P10297]|uniref:Uncharacterized protein n=1 Tax=Phytophthora nicotianae P10297 TaxID=1317064 RepID=W2Z0M1_PHYNI|nr:hypothetical protein F442_12133 [Phytophthora nicotianae P10297]
MAPHQAASLASGTGHLLTRCVSENLFSRCIFLRSHQCQTKCEGCEELPPILLLTVVGPRSSGPHSTVSYQLLCKCQALPSARAVTRYYSKEFEFVHRVGSPLNLRQNIKRR